MFEEGQHLELPEDPLAGNKVLEDVGHLFEGDPLPVSGVRHGPVGAEDKHRGSDERPVCIRSIAPRVNPLTEERPSDRLLYAFVCSSAA